MLFFLTAPGKTASTIERRRWRRRWQHDVRADQWVYGQWSRTEHAPVVLATSEAYCCSSWMRSSVTSELHGWSSHPNNTHRNPSFVRHSVVQGDVCKSLAGLRQKGKYGGHRLSELSVTQDLNKCATVFATTFFLIQVTMRSYIVQYMYSCAESRLSM
jgi:hypothetical protein